MLNSQLNEIDRMEQHFLVGREQEIQLFLNRLHNSPFTGGIINLYGTGGVGKSYLLNEFRRLALLADTKYQLFDCRVLPSNPYDLCLHLLRAFNLPAQHTEQTTDIEQLTSICIDAIQAYRGEGKLIIALDTFEAVGEADRWLREKLLPPLIPYILVVIAGRFPLQGPWLASPGWRQLIYRIPLAELTYAAVEQYLERTGIMQQSIQREVWSKTKGHPLTLSLLVSTMLTGSYSYDAFAEETDVFPHVVANWLQEVPDADMRVMVEAAAVLRQFNLELLNFVLEIQVTSEQFRRLTSYSFIQRVEHGWMLHDLLRDAIGIELRRSSPDYHNRLWLRCVSYYSDKIKRSAKNGTAAWENAEIMYYIGNHFIQFLLYQETISYSLEPLHTSNWAEVEQYLEKRRHTAKDGSVDYVNRETNEKATYLLTARESLNILRQIRLQELYELDSSCVKIIRNSEGIIYGLMEIIPINAWTMDYLRSRPVSSPYFNGISEAERQELSVPRHTKAGYFVKTLDVYDFFDPAMMQASLSTFIMHILSGGYVVAAPTANPISEAILFSLGMEMKQDLFHYDYDGVTPTPYYVMDTRGSKILTYLNQMISSFGGQSETVSEDKAPPAPGAQLSNREREVVERLMHGRSNKEIANELFLSEATVKKHLSNIFEKLGVRNRSQLMSKFKG